MTSFTPRQRLSRAASAAHSPPPIPPATAMAGSISQTCPAGKNRATPVAVSAPRYNCPSPPTLTSPTRVGIAVAKAVRTSGIMVTPTSLRPKELPMTPYHASRRASTGSRPDASRKRAKTARASTRPSAGRGAGWLASATHICRKDNVSGKNCRRRLIGFPQPRRVRSSAGQSPAPTLPLT